MLSVRSLSSPGAFRKAMKNGLRKIFSFRASFAGIKNGTPEEQQYPIPRFREACKELASSPLIKKRQKPINQASERDNEQYAEPLGLDADTGEGRHAINQHKSQTSMSIHSTVEKPENPTALFTKSRAAESSTLMELMPAKSEPFLHSSTKATDEGNNEWPKSCTWPRSWDSIT